MKPIIRLIIVILTWAVVGLGVNLLTYQYVIKVYYPEFYTVNFGFIWGVAWSIIGCFMAWLVNQYLLDNYDT